MRIRFICAAIAISIVISGADTKAGMDDRPSLVRPTFTFVNLDSLPHSTKPLTTLITGRLDYTFVPIYNAQLKQETTSYKTIINDNIILAPESGVVNDGIISLKVLEINTFKLQPHIYKYNEKPVLNIENNMDLGYTYDLHTDLKYVPGITKQELEHYDRWNCKENGNKRSCDKVKGWDKEKLKNEVLAEAPLYAKRMVIEYIIETNSKMMKTINTKGIIRTIFSSNAEEQGLTLGSPMLNTYLTGRDQGSPLWIYNLVEEVIKRAYGGKSPFTKQDMRDLASETYEYLINIIDDKNKDKAMAMPAYLLKQIQLQAGSIDNSDRSAGGNDHHHEEGHHEEPM